jgi:ribosomal protein S18 acetylase RimI-like enzyme
MIDIKIATTDLEIESCWDAMFLLRPMLNHDNFISLINEMQKEGYTLLYVTEYGKTIAVAGYRIFTMLYCGKMVYIDDLSTVESCRGKGYASHLLTHIYDIAKKKTAFQCI